MGEWRDALHAQGKVARGTVDLYISHGAGSAVEEEGMMDDTSGFVDWFIVEPRDDPRRQVESLRRAGREVVRVPVRPWSWRHRLRRWWDDLRFRMSR